MEAKDTAIQAADECEAIPFKWANPEDMYYVRAICETQAEISFKAGIEEVVEWLKQENDKNPRVLDGSFIIAKLNQERWQAKLKEWEIDGI